MDEEIIRWLDDSGLKEEFHTFIQRSDAYAKLFSGLSGWRWEDELAIICGQHGWTWTPSISKTSPYDGKINGKKVQCKATCSANKRIDLRCKKAKNARRYEVEDFDVLALKVVSKGLIRNYFVPARALLCKDNPQLLVGSIKLDSLQAYENNFSVFTIDKLYSIMSL